MRFDFRKPSVSSLAIITTNTTVGPGEVVQQLRAPAASEEDPGPQAGSLVPLAPVPGVPTSSCGLCGAPAHIWCTYRQAHK